MQGGKQIDTTLIVSTILDTISPEHQDSLYYALGGIISDNPMETHVRVSVMLSEIKSRSNKKVFQPTICIEKGHREGVAL